MKTKTIITAIILLFSLTSFAQKLVYQATKDLALKEKADHIFSIDLDSKILNITFQDGDKGTYNIKEYKITKNQEDEDVYPEGVSLTEYYISLEKKEGVIGISSLYLNIPNQHKYQSSLIVRYNSAVPTRYFLVKKIN